VYFVLLIAAIGGILYGADVGVISGALLFMKNDIGLDNQQISFIGSAVLGGGAFATLVTGPLADIFGRRAMIILSAILFLLGVIVVVMATSYSGILFGRLIQGIGIGIITIATPLYIAELMPSHYRGRGLATFQLMLTAGILLAGLIGIYFTNHGGNWRGMFLATLVPGVLFLLGSLFMPGSPRWLILKGRESEALAILKKTRHEDEALLEFQEMQMLTREHAQESHSFWQLLRLKQYWKPFALVCVIAIVQQLTAINSLLQFSALLLKNSGLDSNIVAMMGATGMMALNFLSTILAILLVDKLGRKFLMIVGTLGLTCALLYTAAVLHFVATSPLQGELLMLGLFGFIIFFAIGPGAVIWMILSELLPLKIRSKGMGIGLFLNSLTSAILAAVFLPLIVHLGASMVFLICSGFTFIYFLISWKLLPETKNKTLEEIEEIFA
jgi:sugar porter (SP) family MFS transporter